MVQQRGREVNRTQWPWQWWDSGAGVTIVEPPAGSCPGKGRSGQRRTRDPWRSLLCDPDALHGALTSVAAGSSCLLLHSNGVGQESDETLL